VFGSLYLLDTFPPEQVTRLILNLDLSEGACHSLSATEVVGVVLRGTFLECGSGELCVCCKSAPLFIDSIRRVAGAAKDGR
jgi:hypothetical protein